MKRFALFVASLILAAPTLAAKDQLHLYNWNNYIAPETVKRFEDACKCEAVQTYYSDNEELLAKLAAGAKGYDVMVPTSNAVEVLIKGGQLMPIDAKLANLKNIDPVTSTRRSIPQQVFGPLCHVDDNHRLQRREDKGPWPPHRHVGGDLRSEISGESEGADHRARQRERAFCRGAQVSRLLGQ
jgi:hypothetical protein